TGLPAQPILARARRSAVAEAKNPASRSLQSDTPWFSTPRRNEPNFLGSANSPQTLQEECSVSQKTTQTRTHAKAIKHNSKNDGSQWRLHMVVTATAAASAIRSDPPFRNSCLGTASRLDNSEVKELSIVANHAGAARCNCPPIRLAAMI